MYTVQNVVTALKLWKENHTQRCLHVKKKKLPMQCRVPEFKMFHSIVYIFPFVTLYIVAAIYSFCNTCFIQYLVFHRIAIGQMHGI